MNFTNANLLTVIFILIIFNVLTIIAYRVKLSNAKNESSHLKWTNDILSKVAEDNNNTSKDLIVYIKSLKAKKGDGRN